MSTVFKLKRGDTFEVRFVWKQTESNTPVNLVGVSPRCHIRNKDRELVLDASIYLTTTPEQGLIVLKIPPSKTKLFPLEKLVFDLELTFSNGDVISSDTFTIQVIEDITYNI